MSDKWLHREGAIWVEKGIITREQYDEILKLYPAPVPRFTHVLPVFASILVGLSLLTFVASNWGAIPQLGRLVIMMISLVSFYTSGFYQYQRGHSWLGKGLLVVGVASFGASMVLIGQMFNLIAYDARLFVLWALASLVLLYWYRDPVFFFLTAVLLLAGQVYSVSTFSEGSWLLFGLTVAGLGTYSYQAKSTVVGWILAPLIGIEASLLLTSLLNTWSWIFLIPMGLYVVGIWLEERPVAEGFLTWPAIFGFGLSAFLVFIHQHLFHNSQFMAQPFPYLATFLAFSLLIILKTKRHKVKWLPILLFIPLFYLSFADIAYLAAMFIYASLLIYFGDQANRRSQSNIGVFLFMLCSFIGYVQLAWDFLDKSFFFLIGGGILFAIHWILRRRSRWMRKGEDLA